jgi:hypothetical protein
LDGVNSVRKIDLLSGVDEVKYPKMTEEELTECVPDRLHEWTKTYACVWTGAFVNKETIDRATAIIADDSFAISFQTMGQYRSAILKMLNT